VGTQLLKNMKWQAVEDDAAAEIQNFPTPETWGFKAQNPQALQMCPENSG